jgi:hypothetical protein
MGASSLYFSPIWRTEEKLFEPGLSTGLELCTTISQKAPYGTGGSLANPLSETVGSNPLS